ncbi:MAG: TIGR03936 family radical SAM-associated protein [Bacillota bacterium]
MNNIRARFVRGEEVKYISHLDLMRMFERALRRSGIPIAYSQGFNPHPQLVFGLPLSVGVTSEAEYVDFELSDMIEPGDFMDKLNRNLPSGIRIMDAREKKTKSNIMASIAVASYEVVVTDDVNVGIKEIREILEKFLERQEIYVSKESKGKTKQVNIRPMIYNITVKSIQNTKALETAAKEDSSRDTCENTWILSYIDRLRNEDTINSSILSGALCLSMLLSAGSAANLKPELLVSAFSEFSGFSFDIVKIHRSGLFISKGDKLIDPIEREALLAI